LSCDIIILVITNAQLLVTLFKHILHETDCLSLQTYMSNWMDKWLLKLNVDKCKMVSYGRNVLMNETYNLKQSVLKREDS